MSDYTPPLREFRFLLNNLCDLEALSKLPGYEHADPEFIDGMMEEAGKLFSEVIAPTNQDGDENPSYWKDGEVHTPDSFKEPWQKLVEGGWVGLPFPEGHGGGGMPWLVQAGFAEMFGSSNASLSMLAGLNIGAVDLLLEHGDDEQKTKYMERLISGEWGATMCLTEPQAGTDLGLVTTKAEPAGDGTYRIKGTKIFITFGEHDLTENIVHLVLAKLPDAPPGTKGISLFIVPKYLVDDDGSLGERNDLVCQSIEHKLGIRSSPTCVMSFGENDGAIGYLIGEEHAGMRQMFTMMNNARIAVGDMGVAIPERSYQRAVAYAKERVQGRPLGGGSKKSIAIIQHPDVRRMLMLMSAQLQAMRAMLFVTSEALDMSLRHPDDDIRDSYGKRAALLTPVVKAWCTDVGQDVASLGIQVFGGAGFIEETGMAQYYRDMRIQSIYEGTNGVQALDLIGRKLPIDMGKPVLDLIAEMKQLDAVLAAEGIADTRPPAPGPTDTDVADSLRPRSDGPDQTVGFPMIRQQLADAVAAFEEATMWIFENGLKDPEDAAAGATNYLHLFGTTYGGYLMARSGLAAQEELEKGVDDPAYADYLRAKITSARFYAEQVLPLGTALLGPATAGKKHVFAVPEDVLG